MTKPKTDYDDFLCDARHQALKDGDLLALIKANQELWELYPQIYQHLVGPIYERHRDASHSCYCNVPKSLFEIYGEIISDKMPSEALDCDDCWEIDLLSTWMFESLSLY